MLIKIKNLWFYKFGRKNGNIYVIICNKIYVIMNLKIVLFIKIFAELKERTEYKVKLEEIEK